MTAICTERRSSAVRFDLPAACNVAAPRSLQGAVARRYAERAPDFFGDIGIDVPEAQAEAMRFFWEPVKLLRKTGDATAWSRSRYSRLAPAKAWLSAPTRPTICASQTRKRVTAFLSASMTTSWRE
jgi:hypothetical protein